MRVLEPADIGDCLAVLRALPDWFGIGSAIIEYGEDLQSLDGFVAIEDGKPIGFTGLKRYGSESVEVNVIGVLPDRRGGGTGTALLDVLENPCLVMVKPLR